MLSFSAPQQYSADWLNQVLGQISQQYEQCLKLNQQFNIGGTSETAIISSDKGKVLVTDPVTGKVTTSSGSIDLKIDKTSATGSAVIPSGTTAQRDASPSAGYTRHNSETGFEEFWGGTAWIQLDKFQRPGNVLQVVRVQTSDFLMTTAAIPLDDTIPQISEGAEIFTASITPVSASSRLTIEALIHTSNSAAAATHVVALFRNSVADAMSVAWMSSPGANYAMPPIIVKAEHSPGSTSLMTFKVRAGTLGGNGGQILQVNGASGTRYLGGSLISSIVITEIAA